MFCVVDTMWVSRFPSLSEAKASMSMKYNLCATDGQWFYVFSETPLIDNYDEALKLLASKHNSEWVKPGICVFVTKIAGYKFSDEV